MKKLFVLMLILFSFANSPYAYAGTSIANAPGGEDTSAGGSEKIPVDDAGIGKYMTVDTLLDRYMLTRVECTTDTVLTEAQCYNSYVCNQAATGEVDLTLDDLAYTAYVRFSCEEAQNIEINPPSGEALYLNGTLLDANDCVDSDSVEGSEIAAERRKNSSGSWVWWLRTVTGVWSDTGASD